MQSACMTLAGIRPLARDVYELTFEADYSQEWKPGQFAQLTVPGAYLRRPISVSGFKSGALTLAVKRVGEGTSKLCAMTAGDKVDMLTGLGNGFDTAPSGLKPLLIGGGVGVAPLIMLAEELLSQGKRPRAALGFNTARDAFYIDKLERMGVETRACTVDGSLGAKGFVPALIAQFEYTYFYACGPLPMYGAVERAAVSDGQYSFEARMGCGFGACMGCTIPTKSGLKRVCKEGPVFERGDILWPI